MPAALPWAGASSTFCQNFRNHASPLLGSKVELLLLDEELDVDELGAFRLLLAR